MSPSSSIKSKPVSPWQEHPFQVLHFPTSAGWVRSWSRSQQKVIVGTKELMRMVLGWASRINVTRWTLLAKHLCFLLVQRCAFSCPLCTLLTVSWAKRVQKVRLAGPITVFRGKWRLTGLNLLAFVCPPLKAATRPTRILAGEVTRPISWTRAVERKAQPLPSVIRCCGRLGGSKLCLGLIRYKCAKSYLFMRVFLGVEAWLMDTAFQCLCAAAVRAREVWGISQGWWLPRAPLLAALTSCQPLSINLMFTVSVPKFRMLHQRSVSFQDPSSTNVIFLFSIFFGKLHTPLDNSGSLAMS